MDKFIILMIATNITAMSLTLAIINLIDSVNLSGKLSCLMAINVLITGGLHIWLWHKVITLI